VRQTSSNTHGESDEAWQARCVDHVDKDPITLVSTYRYKAGVADCP
jgi:hypothetical protein